MRSHLRMKTLQQTGKTSNVQRADVGHLPDNKPTNVKYKDSSFVVWSPIGGQFS